MAKADTKIEKIVWVGLDFWLLKLMSNINLEWVRETNIEQNVLLVCNSELVRVEFFVNENICWLETSLVDILTLNIAKVFFVSFKLINYNNFHSNNPKTPKPRDEDW